MSRYILFPSSRHLKEDNSDQELYVLVPVEGLQKQTKELYLPSGLNPYLQVFKTVKYRKKLRQLLLQLAKTDIRRNKDGTVGDKHRTLQNIDYDNAVLDSCNGNFREIYEEFYCLLRKVGITF